MQLKVTYPLAECKVNDTILINVASYCGAAFIVKLVANEGAEKTDFYIYEKARSSFGGFACCVPTSLYYNMCMSGLHEKEAARFWLPLIMLPPLPLMMNT